LQAAEEVVAAINSKREGAAIAAIADVSTIAGGEKMLEVCLRAFGRIDILVPNAGARVNKALNTIDDESLFDWTFDIHVKGPPPPTKAVAPHLPSGTQSLARLKFPTRSSDASRTSCSGIFVPSTRTRISTHTHAHTHIT
jgi:3-oxoacyl-[acyl-carrier protein] reductase